MINLNKFVKNAEKTKSRKSVINEVDIETKFCNYAKSKKCRALKLVFLHKRGFPDRTVICPGGVMFFVEFKREGCKQSAMQKLTQATLEKFGFKYYVCDKIGKAEEILDGYL